jgi:tRNA(adenine34) deaminase
MGMSGETDARFMARALALAAEASVAGEVPVGCVIAEGENLIAEAANAPIALSDPTAHAEMLALRSAASARGNYRLGADATLYVTLEPCAMCAGAISLARIGRLVYAAGDPKGGAVAQGARVFDQPQCHSRPQVETGLCADESAALLRAFFKARR